jgi:acyl-CoA thioester hydrolase
LTVRTILKEWPVGHRIEFNQEVYNEEGKLLTVGKVLLYFLKAATMEKTTMPEHMEEKLAPYFR